MRVYRVEHTESGFGPFHHANHKFCAAWARELPEDRAASYDRHGPNEDSRLRHLCKETGFPKNLRIGCSSKQQLEEWFSPESVKLFERHGFEVRCYEVPAKYAFKGEFQVAFHKSKARLVERYTPYR